MFPPLRRLTMIWQQIGSKSRKTARFACPGGSTDTPKTRTSVLFLRSNLSWRRRMGVEPTLEQEAARATVLKTARPTGTRPPPRPRDALVVSGVRTLLTNDRLATSARGWRSGRRPGRADLCLLARGRPGAHASSPTRSPSSAPPHRRRITRARRSSIAATCRAARISTRQRRPTPTIARTSSRRLISACKRSWRSRRARRRRRHPWLPCRQRCPRRRRGARRIRRAWG